LRLIGVPGCIASLAAVYGVEPLLAQT
jgi:hypothetical protein